MVLGLSGNCLIAGCNINRETNKPECYESMEQHMKSMKIVLDTLFSSYMEFVDEEAKRLCIKPKCHVVYAVAALHDLGKILPMYQKQLREKCTAPYHEVFSAILLFSVKGVWLRESEIIVYMLPVIMHHHAMRSLKDLIGEYYVKIVNPIKKISKVPAEYISEFSSIVEKVFGLKIEVSELNRRIIEENCEKLLKILENAKKLQEGQYFKHKLYLSMLKVYRLTSLILYPLTIADYVAAAVNRACKNLTMDEILRISYKNPMVRDALKYSIQQLTFRRIYNKLLTK